MVAAIFFFRNLRDQIFLAAHCVTNDYGDKLRPEEFMVGAGKYYSKYQDTRDVGAQYSQVGRNTDIRERGGNIDALRKKCDIIADIPFINSKFIYSNINCLVIKL